MAVVTQKVKRLKANQSIERGTIQRDLTAYPDTGNGGNPALFGGNGLVNTGQIPVTPAGTGTGTGTGTPTPTSNPTSLLRYGFSEGSLSSLIVLAPFVPSTNQYGSWPQGNTTQYVERSGTKLGILKSVGACITHISRQDVRGGQNLINTYIDSLSTFEGAVAPDAGRSAGWSTYGTPRGAGLEYSEAGQTTYGIGWNPVQGGSEQSKSRSAILFFERRTVAGYGEVMYTKTQPHQWQMIGVPGKMFIHQWVWINPDGTVGWFYIYENFRDDSQRSYEGRSQEWPFVYQIAPLYRITVDVNGTSEITLPGGSGATGRVFSTGYAITSRDDQGNALILHTPYNSAFNAQQFGGRGGDEFSNSSGYINAEVTGIGDLNVTQAYSGSIFVGSESAGASWVAAQPKMPENVIDYDFSNGKTCGWTGGDGPTTFVNGRYRFGIGHIRPDGSSGFAKFSSPAMVWNAAAINVIYVKAYFFVSNPCLRWKKAGETPQQQDMNYKDFTAVPDGSLQTIAIQMAGVPNWTGKIATIDIGNPWVNGFQRPTRNGTEYLEPVYIGTINPG